MKIRGGTRSTRIQYFLYRLSGFFSRDIMNAQAVNSPILSKSVRPIIISPRTK